MLVVTSLGQSRATRRRSDHLSREVTRMVPQKAWFFSFVVLPMLSPDEHAEKEGGFQQHNSAGYSSGLAFRRKDIELECAVLSFRVDQGLASGFTSRVILP